MSNQDKPISPVVGVDEIDKGRRRILFLIPVGIFAGVAATLATAAFRFLRPAVVAQSDAKWINALPMKSVKGDKPMMCSVVTERTAGWSMAVEEQQVFVLPALNNTVLSSACPHEGCSVTWRDESNDFFCPCHDSSFAPDGTRLSGPARRGLDPLPSREKDGMLQVQYQTFVNNELERIPRA